MNHCPWFFAVTYNRQLFVLLFLSTWFAIVAIGGPLVLFSQETQDSPKPEMSPLPDFLQSMGTEPQQPAYGVVRNSRGWFELDLQDCAKAEKRLTEEVKQFCDTTPGSARVQKYMLRFVYIPDEGSMEFPFDVPFDFLLRLDEVLVLQQRFWQVELINFLQQNSITMYKRRLEHIDEQLGERAREEWLADLQQKLEQEAYQFLHQYFACLRQGNDSCNA